MHEVHNANEVQTLQAAGQALQFGELENVP